MVFNPDANDKITRANLADKLQKNINDGDVKAFVAKQIANQLSPAELKNANSMTISQLLDHIRQNILK